MSDDLRRRIEETQRLNRLPPDDRLDLDRVRARAHAMTAAQGKDRWKIYQGERLVGSVPRSWPLQSTSGIFQVRPRDFRIADRAGEEVLIADGMIGPGDFACLVGFRNAAGQEEEKGDFARQFDALREAGESRFDAIGSVIGRALR